MDLVSNFSVLGKVLALRYEEIKKGELVNKSQIFFVCLILVNIISLMKIRNAECCILPENRLMDLSSK